MNLEEPLPSFDQWLPGAAATWAGVMACLVMLVVAAALVVLVHTGQQIGFDRASARPINWLVTLFSDLVSTSLRRIRAIAWLTVREATRRHGLIGFLLFLLLILPLALWFLDRASPDPAVLYVSSVHWAVVLLVLATVVLLGCTGLPNDIKQKTIYTIVTKPTRATEIVLGRMLGGVTIGTGMLVLMGLLMYLFVHSALFHRHEVDPGEMANISSPNADVRAIRTGRTSLDRHHRHRVTIEADGRGSTDIVQGHWHPIVTSERGGQVVYDVGGPEGQFRARVPQYGKLRFIDRFGNPAEQGTNVGEWTHHRYIFGGSLASATWSFDEVTADRYPQGLRVDMNLLVRRTHRGDIERGVAGSVTLRNPRNGLTSAPLHFLAREYTVDTHLFPRRLVDSQGRSVELFKDLIVDGRVDLVVQCLDNEQFLGMGQTSVYLLESEGGVPANFLKAYFGLWLQMVVVVAVAVSWSTFLNSGVAWLATLLMLVIGFFHDFVRQLAHNQTPGGGTIEAMVRLYQHKNLEQPLPESMGMDVAMFFDEIIRWVLWLIEGATPEMLRFSLEDYLAQGYDIPFDLIAQLSVTTLADVAPLVIFGYLGFKLRELD
ncbi:MAG: hypothetical protein JSS27_10405 [Planctomycetes bacterium]|nr:hypothetical protein [Planctomycetota bacterium]